jgi:hypothetical protein
LSATSLKALNKILGLKQNLFLLTEILSYLATCEEMLFIAFIPAALALEFGGELAPP